MGRPVAPAARIAVVYAIVAVAWIVGSDLVLRRISDSPALETVKGIGFVAVTGAVLYLLVRRLLRSVETAEDARSVAATQLDALVVHHPVVVWTVDRDLRVTALRGRPLEQMGYQVDQVLGRRLPEVMAELGVDPAEVQHFHEVALGGGSVSYERENAGRVFDTYLQPFAEAGGRVRGVVGISLDVTEHRQAERDRAALGEQLAEAQKLDAVGRLAGGIAHDFNNLLTAIGGYAELLLMKLPEDDDRRSYVDEIRSACERATRLTSRLLTVGRRQVQRRESVDLNDLVEDMGSLLRRLIGETIELRVELERGRPLVRADRSQLEQVVLNLVVNARDAMPDGGVVTLATAIAPSGPNVDTPCAVLTVTDTGHGMPDDVRARIFEPFFTTKEPGEGTGLGLATVYATVADSGGAIEVDSAPGAGTTFRAYLPLTRAVEHARPVPSGRGTEALACSVLVVEDEAPVRSFVHEILALEGCDVTEAGDAEEALRLLDGGLEPQLLLTDVVLPRTSGIELASLARERVSGLRVLFMSGYPAEAVERHGFPPGAELISKPFTRDELAARVRAAIASGVPSGR